jgi:PAT family beta-lactamase induction signal transducer AmpG
MLLGIVATLISKEPTSKQTYTIKASFYLSFKSLLNRRDIYYLIGFIFFFKWGEAFTSSISSVLIPFLLSYMGFELSTVGYVNKFFGGLSIVAGGLLAGFLLIRYSLYRCLFMFGIFQAIANGMFIMLAMVGSSVYLLAFCVFFENIATGMGSTAFVAFLMRIVDRRFTATQFSLLVAISTVPRVFSGPIASALVPKIGWIGFYQIIFLTSFMFLPFFYRLIIKEENGAESGNRTHTVSPPPDFESGASTSSAISAQENCIISNKS